MTSHDIAGYLADILNTRLLEINKTPVTISSILMFFLVFAGFTLFSRFVTQVLMVRGMKRMHLDEGTRYTFQRMTHYLIMLIGALVAFQFMGIDLSGLMVIFGFLSVGIGFGLQNLVSNFVAGLILLFEQPIRVGDRVMVGDTEGDVQDINIRSTTVRTMNNISIIVPNSEFISSQVVNWSHRDPSMRLDIDVGVAYDSDLDTVLRCLLEVASESPDILKTPPPDVLHKGFGDSAWNMCLRGWIQDSKQHHVIRSAINCAIVRKFRTHNIEIPFPQRDVHIRPDSTTYTSSSINPLT